ncbi:hypothetical protein VNI00_011852 [Paramarasmius palmivorus]|uniref:Uncharacterized protein n=1 Tax=Paramarasmius palmivorus TaxID=297713 RepID=A0AAW0C901_9AGAR
MYTFVNKDAVIGPYWQRHPSYDDVDISDPVLSSENRQEVTLRYNKMAQVEELDKISDSIYLESTGDPENGSKSSPMLKFSRRRSLLLARLSRDTDSENDDDEVSKSSKNEEDSGSDGVTNLPTDAGSHASDGTDSDEGSISNSRCFKYHLISFPSHEELTQRRPKALWKFALYHVIRDIQSGTLNWKTISARREWRQRYIESVKLHEGNHFLDTISMETDADDLTLWHAIALFQMRRDIADRSGRVSVRYN